MPDLLQPISDTELPNFRFDVTKLNDPIAEQTDWTPLVYGGSKSETRVLKQVGPDRVAFRPSSTILASVVIAFGMFVGMTGIPIHNMIRRGAFAISPLPLVGLVFAGAGCYAIFRFFQPIVFDRRTASFWKGWKSPEKVIRKDELKAHATFDQIHALQIIREHCEDRNSSSGGSRTDRYYSYELNLVLADGARVNVTDHGNQSQIRADAKLLAAFLEKPLWDATP